MVDTTSRSLPQGLRESLKEEPGVKEDDARRTIADGATAGKPTPPWEWRDQHREAERLLRGRGNRS